jgi:hypothetical protein
MNFYLNPDGAAFSCIRISIVERISTTSPLCPPDEKSRQKWWRYHRWWEALSPLLSRYLHQETCRFMFKLARVEVVEMAEIFLVCLFKV